MNLQRILAVVGSRNREFYRDKAGLGWNLLMPVLMLIGFAVTMAVQAARIAAERDRANREREDGVAGRDVGWSWWGGGLYVVVVTPLAAPSSMFDSQHAFRIILILVRPQRRR